MSDTQRTGMTVAEAGRRGAKAVMDKYGPDYMAELGRRGGAATKALHGAGHYSEIGKKGGQKGGKASAKARAERTFDPLAALGGAKRSHGGAK